MIEQKEYSNYNEYLQDNEERDEPVVYDYIQDNNQKSPDELIKSFHAQQMEESDLYEMILDNGIALNLFQSLNKLKRGTDHQLFKNPFQIKIYPEIKSMMIYLIVSHSFLRIKTELLYLRENPKFKKNEESELKNKINSKSKSGESQESQSVKVEQSKKEKEIIFTLELIEFYEMFQLLLCNNKDHPLSLSIDKDFSILSGRIICPNVYIKGIDGVQYKCRLVKNELFAYKINPPEEQKYKEESKISKNFFNELENQNNSDSSNMNINNVQSNSMSQINQLNEEESDFLEKKFQTDEKSARYIIEGSDLQELNTLMRGLESMYNYDLSEHSIGISMTNDKALFYSLAYEKIKDLKSFSNLSKAIKFRTLLNIKSIKNHFLTPFKYGFNSFFRTKLLAKFITSFYNPEDKRLMVRVSTSGKMILSFAFSEPKNDMVMNEMMNNDIGISTEIYDNLEENNRESEINRNKKERIIKGGFFNDENGGNIVGMIFYPTVFDLCKC